MADRTISLEWVDGVEVVYSNIVLVPADLAIVSADLVPKLKSPEFSKQLGRSASVSQGLLPDPERGQSSAFIVEGIHGRKAATISQVRIEATDRTGSLDLSNNKLITLMRSLIDISGVEEIRAAGVNFDVIFDAPGEQRAGSALAISLLEQRLASVRGGWSLTGGSTRLFYRTETDRTAVVLIEPRFQDIESTEAYASVNVTVHQKTIPTDDEFRTIYNEGIELLREILSIANVITGE